MKILIYENRKSDPIYWDASTPEKEEAALWCLFKVLEEWECYEDLHGFHLDLYRKAKRGQFAALKQLLHVRKEYERFSWGELLDPLPEAKT